MKRWGTIVLWFFVSVLLAGSIMGSAICPQPPQSEGEGETNDGVSVEEQPQGDAEAEVEDILGDGEATEGEAEGEDTLGDEEAAEGEVEGEVPLTAPEVSITQPGSSQTFTLGTQVTFNGTAIDGDSPEEELIIRWSSDLDGLLNADPPDATGLCGFSTSELGLGRHTITLRATDFDGLFGEAAIEVIIAPVTGDNQAPTISITAPSETFFSQGTQIDFQAQASDAEDTGPSLQVEWRSDVDGLLSTANADASGLSQFSTSSLSVGSHSIRVMVTDSSGSRAADTLRVTVGIDYSPNVNIVSPRDGAVYLGAPAITFSGTALDAEQANDTLTARWESDRDGILNEDPPAPGGLLQFSATLSSGIHFVTLTVSDDGGNVSTVSTQVIVTERVTTTPVSGEISADTTWTASESPYQLTGEVTVLQGVTLTIGPGCVMLMDPASKLTIGGSLICRGTYDTPESQILFTSGAGNGQTPAAGDWQGIEFTNTSVPGVLDSDFNYVSGSIIEVARVRFAGNNSSRAIRAAGASPALAELTCEFNAGGGLELVNSDSTLVYCSFSANQVTGDGGGVRIQGGSPTLVYTSSSYNEATGKGGGVYISSTEGVTLNGCDVHSNASGSDSTSGQGGGGGIYADGSASNPIRIQNCTINNNFVRFGDRGAGVYALSGCSIEDSMVNSNYANDAGAGGGVYFGIATGGANQITDSIIYDNSAATDGGGVYAQGAATVSGNRIASNNAGQRGGGVFVVSGSSSQNLQGNVFNLNSSLAGAALYGGEPTLGDFSGSLEENLFAENTSELGTAASVSILGHPTVSGNNFLDDTSTQLETRNNADSADITATGNYWGTASESEIALRIRDGVDLPASLGLVDFSGFLAALNDACPPQRPTELTATRTQSGVRLTWTAPGENDITAYRIYYDSQYDPYNVYFSGNFDPPGISPIEVGNVTQRTLQGLPSDQTIFFAVTAVDSAAQESWFSTQVTLEP